MNANEALALRIIKAVPTCGTATKAWPLLLWQEFLPPLHDRALWRENPFGHEDKDSGVHWITEVMAILCSDLPSEVRMKKIKSLFL